MKKFTLAGVFIAIFVRCSMAQFATGGTQISYASANNHRAFVSAIPGGNYYVTWVVTNVGNINEVKLAAYDTRGVVLPGWTSGGKTIGPSTGNFYAPQIITTQDSGVIITWHGSLGDSSFSRIFAQKYTLTGQPLWNSGNPLQITTGTNNTDQSPIIISDLDNGAFIAWTRYDLAADANSADVYLQHITATGTVASGWNPAATGVATTAGLQECWPQLTLTPDRSAVYVSYASGPAQATSLIINKFNTSNGEVATGWTASGQTVSPGPNVLPQINCNVKLYTDADNNAVIFWLEQRLTVNGEIYMQQISPAGDALLAGKGLMLVGNINGGEGVNSLQAVQDADQNFSITYNNLITNNDVAAMRVQANGTVLWSDSLITTGGASGYPYPAYDGNGGMYIFYANTNAPEKLFAIALNNGGNIYQSWSLPGSSFGAINNYDPANPNYDINAITMANGQAIVAFNRLTTSGYYEIYTCNLLSSGKNCTQCIPVTTTPQGNIALCQGHQLTLSIAPDPNLQYAWLINNINSIDSSSSIHVADSGSYVVIVHSLQQNCSDTSNLVTVSLNASPTVSLSPFADNVICNNAAAVTLQDGAPEGGVFSGPGISSNDIFTPGYAAIGDNVILYTYTNNVGCSTSAAQSITVNNCEGTGIEPVATNGGLQIYPNPASGGGVVNCLLPAGLQNATIIIYDMPGRQTRIYKVDNNQSQISIDLNNMSNGVYLYSLLVNEKVVATGRLIVE